MIKTLFENVLLTGESNDNWLVDFPAYLQIRKNCFYKLNVRDKLKPFQPLDNALILQFNKNILQRYITDDGYNFMLPLTPIHKVKQIMYKCYVDWGDGTEIQQILSWNDKNKSHIYSSEFLNNFQQDTFQIKIIGLCYGFNNKKYIDAGYPNFWEGLTAIRHWGDVSLISLNYAFYNAINLAELPDTTFAKYTILANNCFQNCIRLTKLPINFSFGKYLTSINYFFKNTGLTNLSNNTNFKLVQNIKEIKRIILRLFTFKKRKSEF